MPADPDPLRRRLMGYLVGLIVLKLLVVGANFGMAAAAAPEGLRNLGLVVQLLLTALLLVLLARLAWR